jgi:hypothetical protein
MGSGLDVYLAALTAPVLMRSWGCCPAPRAAFLRIPLGYTERLDAEFARSLPPSLAGVQGTVAAWAQAVNAAVAAQPRRPRRLLVIVNPYGGARQARALYQSVVRPVFAKAGGAAGGRCLCPVNPTAHTSRRRRWRPKADCGLHVCLLAWVGGLLLG